MAGTTTARPGRNRNGGQRRRRHQRRRRRRHHRRRRWGNAAAAQIIPPHPPPPRHAASAAPTRPTPLPPPPLPARYGAAGGRRGWGGCAADARTLPSGIGSKCSRGGADRRGSRLRCGAAATAAAAAAVVVACACTFRRRHASPSAPTRLCRGRQVEWRRPSGCPSGRPRIQEAVAKREGWLRCCPPPRRAEAGAATRVTPLSLVAPYRRLRRQRQGHVPTLNDAARQTPPFLPTLFVCLCLFRCSRRHPSGGAHHSPPRSL